MRTLISFLLAASTCLCQMDNNQFRVTPNSTRSQVGSVVFQSLDSSPQSVLWYNSATKELAVGNDGAQNKAGAVVAGAVNSLLNPLAFVWPVYTCNSSNVCSAGGTSGAALSIGNNTLTLTPVPSGVYAADTTNAFHVSGGTGSAESCTFTGTGTAVGSAVSGTVQVKCVGVHSGSFTIGPANAGASEAYAYCVNAMGGVCDVQYPNADSIWHFPLTIPLPSNATTAQSGFGLSGTATKTSRILIASDFPAWCGIPSPPSNCVNGEIIVASNGTSETTSGPTIQNLSIVNPQPLSSSISAYTQYPPVIYDNYVSGLKVLHVTMPGAWIGIYTNNSAQHVIDDVQIGAYYHGLDIENSYDVDRVHNVHLWPFADTPTPVQQYIDAMMDPAVIGIYLNAAKNVEVSDSYILTGTNFWATSSLTSFSNTGFDGMGVVYNDGGYLTINGAFWYAPEQFEPTGPHCSQPAFSEGNPGGVLISNSYISRGCTTQLLASVNANSGGYDPNNYFKFHDNVLVDATNATSVPSLFKLDGTVGGPMVASIHDNTITYIGNQTYTNPMMDLIGAGIWLSAHHNNNHGVGTGTWINVASTAHQYQNSIGDNLTTFGSSAWANGGAGLSSNNQYLPLQNSNAVLSDSVVSQHPTNPYVGVNYAVPDRALVVGGANPTIGVYNSAGGSLALGAPNTGSGGFAGYIDVGTASLEFNAGSAHRMWLDGSTGYLGIGTSSPGYPLDVNGVINSNSAVQGQTGVFSGNIQAATATLTGLTGGSGGTAVCINANVLYAGGCGTAYGGTGTANYITKWTGANSFENSGITDDGGIATSEAVAISNQLSVTQGFSHFGYNTLSVPPSDNVNGGLIIGWNQSDGLAETDLYNAYDLSGTSGTAFQFKQKTGSSTFSNLMTIMGSGFVGINTTLPSQALEVNGNAKVDGNGVFLGNIQAANDSWTPLSTGVTGIGLSASGPYGGGIGLVDGPYTLGAWSEFGIWYFGQGTTSTAMTTNLTLDRSGNMAVTGWEKSADGLPDIMQYGCVSGMADATSCTQTAVTAASGGAIRIPAGTWNLSKINVPSNIRVTGDGWATQINSLNTAGAYLGVFDVNNQTNVKIDNLSMDGGKTTPTGVTYACVLFAGGGCPNASVAPIDPYFLSNNLIAIHGSSNITIDHVLLQHSPAEAIYLDFSTQQGNTITIKDSLIQNNRPFLFGDSGTENYGGWFGGVMYYSAGSTAVSNLSFINDTFKWNAGHGIFGYNIGSMFNEGVLEANCHFESTGLDSILNSGVSGLNVLGNTILYSGFVSLTDNTLGTPQWYNGTHGSVSPVAVDSADVNTNLTIVGNNVVYNNGGGFDLDGTAYGVISANRVYIPSSIGCPSACIDPDYVSSIVTAMGPGGSGNNYSSGFNLGNTNNTAEGASDLDISGNTCYWQGGGCIRGYAARGDHFHGNTILMPDNSNSTTAHNFYTPIVLGNIGSGVNQRAINNTVTGNKITYPYYAGQPGINAVFEDPSGTAFTSAQVNQVYDNDLNGNLAQFLKDANSSSVGYGERITVSGGYTTSSYDACNATTGSTTLNCFTIQPYSAGGHNYGYFYLNSSSVGVLSDFGALTLANGANYITTQPSTSGGHTSFAWSVNGGSTVGALSDNGTLTISGSGGTSSIAGSLGVGGALSTSSTFVATGSITGASLLTGSGGSASIGSGGIGTTGTITVGSGASSVAGSLGVGGALSTSSTFTATSNITGASLLTGSGGSASIGSGGIGTTGTITVGSGASSVAGSLGVGGNLSTSGLFSQTTNTGNNTFVGSIVSNRNFTANAFYIYDGSSHSAQIATLYNSGGVLCTTSAPCASLGNINEINAVGMTLAGTGSANSFVSATTVQAGSGAYIVYRCLTAGTLPIGTLTVDPTKCGSTADSLFRSN